MGDQPVDRNPGVFRIKLCRDRVDRIAAPVEQVALVLFGRVVENPEFALHVGAGHEECPRTHTRGTPRKVRLFENEDREPGFACGDRRNHAGTTRTDHHEVNRSGFLANLSGRRNGLAPRRGVVARSREGLFDGLNDGARCERCARHEIHGRRLGFDHPRGGHRGRHGADPRRFAVGPHRNHRDFAVGNGDGHGYGPHHPLRVGRVGAGDQGFGTPRKKGEAHKNARRERRERGRARSGRSGRRRALGKLERLETCEGIERRRKAGNRGNEALPFGLSAEHGRW